MRDALHPPASSGGDLAAAREGWIALLGEDRVLPQDVAERRYGVCTAGIRRTIPAALLPASEVEVIEIVRIAHRCRVPIYPISTGHNWGYGTANPAVDGCVVVDLSRLDRILDFDPELGLVTLEPGVTQQALADFLDRGGHPFLVPTTGAGPTCSILGNALERGYGITPVADHFAAVTSLEAVLPDGTVYRSGLSELGAREVDRAFKWGIGPYLDGIFTQGAFGIVTRMTLALARRPAGFVGFFFSLRDPERLDRLVGAVRDVEARLEGVVSAINLMNRHRVLAMTVPYPPELVGRGRTLPPAHVERLGREYQIMAWTGAGALYGEPAVVAAARRTVRKLLRPVVDRLWFMTPARAAALARLAALMPGAIGTRGRRVAAAVQSALQILLGRPSDVALQVMYWKLGGPPGLRPLDPARDGCGLIWYTPLVPLKPPAVVRYVEHVTSTCLAHGMEPLITLTTMSPRCFDSSVPLLFDRADEEQARRAAACYRALLDDGLKLGYAPYRLPPDAMRRVVDGASRFWGLVGALKRAIDPDGIVAPGRYAPLVAVHHRPEQG